MLFKCCFDQLIFSPLFKDEFKIWFCAKVRIMPSVGASPLQNPNPIVHKVSNGHAVHFCESAAEENKNDLNKYLPVSNPEIQCLLIFKVSGVNTHSAVHANCYFCLKGSYCLFGAQIFSSITCYWKLCNAWKMKEKYSFFSEVFLNSLSVTVQSKVSQKRGVKRC